MVAVTTTEKISIALLDVVRNETHLADPVVPQPRYIPSERQEIRLFSRQSWVPASQSALVYRKAIR